MHRPTLLFAGLMILLGVGAYFVTGRESMTAMIPAFVGALIAVCGFAAAKARKSAIIAAIVLGGLAVLGPFMRVLPAVFRGEFELNAATSVQILFIVVAVAMIVTLVGSLRGGKA